MDCKLYKFCSRRKRREKRTITCREGIEKGKREEELYDEKVGFWVLRRKKKQIKEEVLWGLKN